MVSVSVGVIPDSVGSIECRFFSASISNFLSSP